MVSILQLWAHLLVMPLNTTFVTSDSILSCSGVPTVVIITIRARSPTVTSQMADLLALITPRSTWPFVVEKRSCADVTILLTLIIIDVQYLVDNCNWYEFLYSQADYNILEDVKRIVDSAKRMILQISGKHYAELPDNLRKLLNASRHRSIRKKKAVQSTSLRTRQLSIQAYVAAAVDVNDTSGQEHQNLHTDTLR
ncbi:hypothetical protein Tco_1266360 [Tanacetum coccineum]